MEPGIEPGTQTRLGRGQVDPRHPDL
jgi:hypothetical protein